MSGFWKALRSALLVGLVGALTLGQAPQVRGQETTGPTYEVQPGDTLASIAQQFGLSLDALQAANPGVDPAALPVGRQLVVPGYDGVAGRLAVHALEPGETLDSLSLRLGFTRASLVRLNHVINPARLYIHQSIVITDQPDAGPAFATGRVIEARAGSGWLSAASAARMHPWALAAANGLAHPWVSARGSAWLWPAGMRRSRGCRV